MNNTDTTTNLTFKYSALQALYWISICALSGFMSLILISKNFTAGQIGLVVTTANVFVLLIQPRLANFADSTTKYTLKHFALCIAVFPIIANIFLLFPTSFGVTAISATISLMAATLLNSLLNSICIYYINHGKSINYGLARGLGSISFAIISVILGLTGERFGEKSYTIIGLIFFTIFFFVILSLKMENMNTPMKSATSSEVVKKNVLYFFKTYPRFSIMLLGIMLIHIFQSFYGTYLPQILENVGGSSKNVGICLALAAAAELPTLLLFSFMIRKISSGVLMKVAAVAFSVRVIFILLATSTNMLYFAQLFQMFSVGIYLPASVFYTNQIMQKEDMVKGQSFIITAQVCGSIVGTLIGGNLIDHIGVTPVLFVGTIISVIGTITMIGSIQKVKTFIYK